MYIRSLKDVEKQGMRVDWGGGSSHRLVTAQDKMGFAVCHTIVSPGTASKLEYKNHLEACYCICGHGEVETPDGTIYKIPEGTIYVLDQHDAHILRNNSDADWVLVSIFTPPLTGNEVHNLTDDGYSGY